MLPKIHRWVAENISEGEGQQLESGNAINGEFFISFESVKSHFKYGNICYFNPFPSTDDDSSSGPKKWEVSAFEGEWISEKTAGGRYIAKGLYIHTQVYSPFITAASLVLHYNMFELLGSNM